MELKSFVPSYKMCNKFNYLIYQEELPDLNSIQAESYITYIFFNVSKFFSAHSLQPPM